MTDLIARCTTALAEIAAAGLMKSEVAITSPQRARITVSGQSMINLCANNYLGLADHPALIAAAHGALDSHGFGMASVRFICGTQDLHQQLEARLAAYLGCEDAILFAACFDANGGLFAPLLGAEDAVISDALNHASIIDGIRLCRARRYRYANRDMDALEDALKQARAQGSRSILIATDGVFSMDGTFAPLPEITALAAQYDASVMVDDCHATGFVGPQGRGTPAQFGCTVDLLTGTLGKALGGAMGGYIAGAGPVIALLRQRARPYLFSNSLPPAIAAAALCALDLIEAGNGLRATLNCRTATWRKALTEAGFAIGPGSHPIVPVHIGGAAQAQAMAASLARRGVHAVAFSYPVVPQDAARIRTQMSAALSPDDLDHAAAAFVAAAHETGTL